MDDNELIARLHDQISAACIAQDLHIDELQQTYLAHLILRFAEIQTLTTDTQDVDIPLQSLQPDQLHLVADECLLRCGLQIQASSASGALDSQLIRVGRESYRLLGEHLQGPSAQLFLLLDKDFVDLATVLQTLVLHSEHLMSGFDWLEAWRDIPSSEVLHGAHEAFGDQRIIAFDRQGWTSLH
ncbi:MAG: hypothetical protein AAF420_09920 [Pseudomonadota bacterium]